MKRLWIMLVVIPGGWLVACQAQEKSILVNSPDQQLSVKVWMAKGGTMWYTAYRNGLQVLQPSALGLIRSDADFSKQLAWLGASRSSQVKDEYTLLTAKKSRISYVASEQVIYLRSANSREMQLIFQVSNDGLGFCYEFSTGDGKTHVIKKEITSFQLPREAKAWLQPMSPAKSGWEHTNPSYEEHYLQGITAGTPAPLKAGWVYPALFHYRDNWLLISETGIDSNYCGTRLVNDSGSTIYKVGFPDKREVFPGGDIYPVKTGRYWRSPWRIVVIGTLKTIAESTLGTDLALPPIPVDPSLIKPGKAVWSWIMSKDDSIVYSEQKRYIDFAAEMHWQYCLVDVNWDTKIGYEKIRELAAYAASKDVGLLLWYNSAGNWNTTPYHPKDKLLTRKLRQQEFSRLREMGDQRRKNRFLWRGRAIGDEILYRYPARCSAISFAGQFSWRHVAQGLATDLSAPADHGGGKRI